MKPKKLSKLLILTSIALFSACSNKTPEITKSKLSNSDIIEAKKAKEIAYLESLPIAKTYPIVQKRTIAKVENYKYYDVENNTVDTINNIETIDTSSRIEIISQPKSIVTKNNIEVVSYASYQPRVNKILGYNNSKIKNKIERDAKKFLGIKYVWGATGPRKFDCSGFTQWVYRDAGIKIPRVSRDQAKVGNYVTYANLKKGDMVFFDTKKKRTGKVCHVGIYLGHNNFIHASSGAKKVVIYNFNKKPYYKKRFLWGRRVINSKKLLAMK
jgi:cell wall-associated NlpC family hydrolase